MDFERLKLKRLLTVSTRSVAALALTGLLLAACGDDDDDDGGDTDATPTTEMTTPTAADETGDGPTATEATGADGTEAEDAGTGTEEETAPEDMGTETEAEDGTEVEGTETEEDDAAGTGTEDEGTATEAEDDMTATEEDDTDTDATGTEDEDEAEGTAPEGGDTVELGETVELGDLAITVEGVTDIESTAGIVEPESGMRFVAIEATIENTGSEDISLFDVFSQMRLEDTAGEEFDADLLANALLLLEGQGLAEPRIEAGSEVSGMIGFQVPEDGEGLMLVLESDTGESIEIDLSGGQ